MGNTEFHGLNENGEKLLEMCSEKRLSVGNTWFQKKLIQKYTREEGNGQETNLTVLVDERNKRLEDVNVYMGAAGGVHTNTPALMHTHT